MERGLIIFFGGVDTVDNPCSPLLARILGVDVDVDSMSTSWRGVWTQMRRPKAVGPVHSLSTASSAGAAPRMWMVGGAKAP